MDEKIEIRLPHNSFLKYIESEPQYVKILSKLSIDSSRIMMIIPKLGVTKYEAIAHALVKVNKAVTSSEYLYDAIPKYICAMQKDYLIIVPIILFESCYNSTNYNPDGFLHQITNIFNKEIPLNSEGSLLFSKSIVSLDPYDPEEYKQFIRQLKIKYELAKNSIKIKRLLTVNNYKFIMAEYSKVLGNIDESINAKLFVSELLGDVYIPKNKLTVYMKYKDDFIPLNKSVDEYNNAVRGMDINLSTPYRDIIIGLIKSDIK